MAITWQFARSTLYEQEQLLRAGFSLSPNVADHYECHISTTQPHEDGTNVTEYSGNGYAPVTIPAWSAPSIDPTDRTDAALPANQQKVQLAYCTPAANIVFPNPTASWWANGTTVYPYLTDQSGNARWWWSATTPTAPHAGFPLQFNRIDPVDGVSPATAIAVGIQSLSNIQVFSILSREVASGALGRLTKTTPVYAMPALYAGVGNRASSPKEPDDPGLCYWCGHFRFRTTSGDPDYPDGSVAPDSPFQSLGSGHIKDTGYARQAVAWSYGGLDADGRPYVKNSAAVSWALGGNTETSHVSGDSLPSVFGSTQLQWQRFFFFDPTLAYPISPTYFALWGRSSGGTGGPAPGGMYSAGDIWAYLFPDTYDVIAPREFRWVFWPYTPYEISGFDETHAYTVPPDYSAHGYLFELQTDGNWHNTAFGSLTPVQYAAAIGRLYHMTLFTWLGSPIEQQEALGGPDGSGGFLYGPAGYYRPTDTVGFDAGSILFRIR